ncbi:MAG: cell wall protein [Myxococcaceae bacterium]
MSFDKMIRELVAEEVERVVAPLAAAISQLEANGAVLARLAGALGQPLKRGPGRPPKLAFGKRGTPGRKASGRVCAVKGCGKKMRSKGYCAAHYQKYRNLEKTGRLPADWVPDAAPNTVKNIVLPRGRAGAAALAASKKKA